MTTSIEMPSARLEQRIQSARSRTGWIALLVVWLASGFYTASLLQRGWVPHDEGTLAQSAERVNEGQLPHRDFDEVYTGGLSYVNAAAFRLLGENLLSPRIVLFAVFLSWVPVVFLIASRFAKPVAAGAATLLAVAWSVPNYTAAMPSWYNLFFATFGIAAVLRWMDRGTRRWLFVAGVCGGVSFLFKLSGLYFVAGILLFLAYFEQDSAKRQSHAPGRRSSYSLFLAAALLAFVLALYLVVRARLSFVAVVEFVLPGAALAWWCAVRESEISLSSRRRFEGLWRLAWPFAAGVCLPVLIVLVPYIRSGSVGDFINGVFVLPGRRLEFAARRPPGFGLNKILATIALCSLLIAVYKARLRSWLSVGLIAVALLLAFITSRNHPSIFSSVWAPLALLIPLSTIAGIAVLRKQATALNREPVLLLMAAAATCSLVQLPFPVGIYFCYVTPLVVLSLLALFSTSKRVSGPLLATLLLFYLAFAVFRVTPGFIYVMGNFYQPNPQTTVLQLPRAGGLRVEPSQVAEYERLIPLVEQHAGASPFIYAAPDCPEVYFLSGKKNPTRTLFDFFEDADANTLRVLRAIDEHDIKVVTILVTPEFSPPMAAGLQSDLRRRFPESQQVGRFEVRWRP